MNHEITKVLFTAAVTVISGATIVVTGQIITKLYIEPIQQFKRTLGEVGAGLSFWANVYTAWWTQHCQLPQDMRSECRVKIRNLSTTLLRDANCIPNYDTLARFGVLPSRAQVIESSSELILISNSEGGELKGITEARDTIESNLSLRFTPNSK